MPKRAANGGASLGGLAPKQHGFEKTTHQWRAVGDTASDFTGLGIETQISRVNSGNLNHYANKPELHCEGMTTYFLRLLFF